MATQVDPDMKRKLEEQARVHDERKDCVGLPFCVSCRCVVLINNDYDVAKAEAAVAAEPEGTVVRLVDFVLPDDKFEEMMQHLREGLKSAPKIDKHQKCRACGHSRKNHPNRGGCTRCPVGPRNVSGCLEFVA